MRRRSAAPRTQAARPIRDEVTAWSRLAAGMRAALRGRIDRIGDSFDDTLTIASNAAAVLRTAQQHGIDVRDVAEPVDAAQELRDAIDRLRSRLEQSVRDLE